MPDKRLIDANALETEIIKEYFTKDNPSGMLTKKGEEIFNAAIDVARCRVRDAESIDAVPVVRCRECKHSIAGVVSDDEKRMVRCTVFHDWIDRDGYCHSGAKMDGGEPHEENPHTL